MKRIILSIAGALVAGVFLRGCFIGPEGEIRKQLSTLEELVSFEAGEGDLSALASVRRLGGLFSEEAEVTLSGFGERRRLQGRTELQQAAMAARSQAGRLQASLHDLEIRLSEDERSAAVRATGRAKVGGDERAAVQELVFEFEKGPDGWLIISVENVQALR